MRSGSFSTNEYSGRSLTFSWSIVSQSIQDNNTKIEWELKGDGTRETSYWLTQNVTLKINDDVVYNFPKSQGQIKLYKGTVVATGSYTFIHDEDGSCSFNAYAEAGIYEWTVNCRGSAKFDLDKIARASTITYAADTVLGEACNVQWKPATDTYKYKLEFSMNDTVKTTDFIEPKSTDPFTYTDFIIPIEYANGMTDRATDEMTVKLYTYDADGNKIGTETESTITVTVPDSLKPDVVIESITSDTYITEDTAEFIQGKSHAVVQYTVTAKNNATITSESVTVGGVPVDEVINTYGEIEVAVTATDSRGLSNTVTQTITVCPYAKPKILPASGQDRIICTRCKSSGEIAGDGEYLRIIARSEYSTVNQHNGVSFWFRYKLSSAGDEAYSAEITIASDNGICDAVVDSVVFDKRLSYIVQIGVSDTVGESASVTFTVLSENVFWHRGADYLALGMMSNWGGFESAWDATFYKDVYIVKDNIRMSLESYILKVVNGG